MTSPRDTDLDAPGRQAEPPEDNFSLTPEEEAAAERREPVEDALLLAEATAAGAGEPVLASCLARLQLLWDLGQEGHALRLLDKARDAVIAALREAGLDGGEEGSVG